MLLIGQQEKHYSFEINIIEFNIIEFNIIEFNIKFNVIGRLIPMHLNF